MGNRWHHPPTAQSNKLKKNNQDFLLLLASSLTRFSKLGSSDSICSLNALMLFVVELDGFFGNSSFRTTVTSPLLFDERGFGSQRPWIVIVSPGMEPAGTLIFRAS